MNERFEALEQKGYADFFFSSLSFCLALSSSSSSLSVLLVGEFAAEFIDSKTKKIWLVGVPPRPFRGREETFFLSE